MIHWELLVLVSLTLITSSRVKHVSNTRSFTFWIVTIFHLRTSRQFSTVIHCSRMFQILTWSKIMNYSSLKNPIANFNENKCIATSRFKSLLQLHYTMILISQRLSDRWEMTIYKNLVLPRPHSRLSELPISMM